MHASTAAGKINSVHDTRLDSFTNAQRATHNKEQRHGGEVVQHTYARPGLAVPSTILRMSLDKRQRSALRTQADHDNGDRAEDAQKQNTPAG